MVKLARFENRCWFHPFAAPGPIFRTLFRHGGSALDSELQALFAPSIFPKIAPDYAVIDAESTPKCQWRFQLPRLRLRDRIAGEIGDSPAMRG